MDINIKEIKTLAKRLRKAKEIMTRNCKWRARDGHSFSCDYDGSQTTRCNKEGRVKCPLINLLDE